jgi:mediator of RNA polymerase II transcription subunit 16
MPLMMDEDDMDVDINDLFGDGAELSLPVRAPPKELFQRIDELRGSGACQYGNSTQCCHVLQDC